ncbi:hypothetical protein DFI_00730 [Deinococcus ficus]|uniref:DUF11 domain-containing protein n=2 Tax=Deinococcus ficus TaxID=317577 RepID=A0A221SSW0_9DEIO|nr:hypothetical protein DFI_00730 [Deinococcus ficus]
MNMRAPRLLRRLGAVLAPLALLLGAGQATAAPQLSVTPITWNVIGLDSNKVNEGPDIFPVGVRVCNTGDAVATGVKADFAWVNPANTAITLIGQSSIALQDLPAGPAPLHPNDLSRVPTNCQDAYFNVRITRTVSAFSTWVSRTATPAQRNTSTYLITASATGASPVSTPSPRELFVEKIQSQNRNEVTSFSVVSGASNASAGQVLQLRLEANTSTGYLQLENYPILLNTVFQILDVQTTYNNPAGSTNSTAYADACGWINDPASADYLQNAGGAYCNGPDHYGGGIGGRMVSIYTVRVLSGAVSTINNVIYDLSGGSYHYNSDYNGGQPTVTITSRAADLTLQKTASAPAFTVGGTVSFTFAVKATGADVYGKTTITDPLPAGLTLPDGPVSLTGAGASNWSCTSLNNTLTCTSTNSTGVNAAPLILEGASSVFTVNGIKVTADALPSVTNTASVSNPFENPSATGNNTGSVTIPVTQPAAGVSACVAAGGTLGSQNRFTYLSNGTFGTMTSSTSYRDLDAAVKVSGGYTFAGASPAGGAGNYLVPEGLYVITPPSRSGQLLNQYGPWAAYYGHTDVTASDAYLAVNGLVNKAGTILQANVPVTAATVYEFGVWSRSTHLASSQFGGVGQEVKIVLSGTPGTQPQVSQQAPNVLRGSPWTLNSLLLNSGNATSLLVALGNAASAQEGNDFYLDDLYVVTCTLPAGTVSGRVFNDLNRNGVQDAGEGGIQGVTVQATDRNGAALTAVTDAAGLYTFTGLPAALGTYTVQVLLSSAPLSTMTATTSTVTTGVTVTPAATTAGGNFGYAVAPAFTITKQASTTLLRVSDTANSLTMTPGQFTYTITVRNTGGSAATGARVTDVLPAGLTYVAGSTTGTPGPGEPAVTGVTSGPVTQQRLEFTLPTLAAGAQQVFTFTVTPTVTRDTAQSAFLNTATVSLSGVTPATSAATRTEVLYVKLVKGVRNVTRNEAAFGTTSGGTPGDVLEYCISFYNYSSLALVKFQIQDVIPANTTALLTGYDAEEPSATTGFGVRVQRPDVPSYQLSSGDTSDLTVPGASLTAVRMTTNLGTLALADQGRTCFRVTVK